jgi:flavodoxin
VKGKSCLGQGILAYSLLSVSGIFMKALVIFFSYHHNNTQKVAEVIVQTLGAEQKNLPEVKSAELANYDLVGFGSGIYFGKLHKTLLDFVDNMPLMAGKKAFVFSTSGQTGRSDKFHKSFKEKLGTKGFEVVGEFNCGGLDTYALTKLVGGIQKGHPNEADLSDAKAFAEGLKQKI